MAAVKAGQVERVLKGRIDPAVIVLLLYGPDAGLVSERARAAAESEGGADDAFQLVRLEGEAVSADPGRLVDEAQTISLFGGRRTVWVRPTSRNIAPAVEALLSLPLPDTRIVIEAGDLGRTSPLRTACERSERALALPCYPDGARDLGAVIDEAVRGAGLELAPEARGALIASLGGDRLASRGELEKLVLYARGSTRITRDDVDAVVSDVSALATEVVVDAAFTGDRGRTVSSLQQAREAGVTASSVLGAALRHGLALLGVLESMAATNAAAGAAVQGWRGLHFSRKDAAARQLTVWSPARLRDAIGRLQAAVLAGRRAEPRLGESIAARALLDVTAGARARSSALAP